MFPAPRFPDAGGTAFGLARRLAVLLRSLFTAADGTALTAYTPDKGGAWTVAAGGTWDISGDRARLVKALTSRDYAWQDAGRADVTVRAVCRAGNAACTPGVLLRVSDANNNWAVRFHPAGGTFSIFERAAGVFTERAVTAVATTAGTDYLVQGRATGTTVSATLNGASPISYGSATFNQAETRHGLHSLNDAGVQTDLFDNFEVTR